MKKSRDLYELTHHGFLFAQEISYKIGTDFIKRLPRLTKPVTIIEGIKIIQSCLTEEEVLKLFDGRITKDMLEKPNDIL